MTSQKINKNITGLFKVDSNHIIHLI